MRYPYGKSILITGASSGIGEAAAQIFAADGWVVFAASRSGACSAAGAISLVMDVTDEESVARAVAYIKENGAALPRVVLHCAGYGIAGAAEDTPDADARAQFEVNYFGTLRVNRHILPLFREEGGGLAIMMSSVAGRLPLPYQSHYSASKYAIDSYTESLRMEGRQFGIRAALVEPGDTATGFTKARKMATPHGSPYRKNCESAVARMAHDEEHGASPLLPAKACLRLATMSNPPVRVTVGLPYKAVLLLRRLLPARLCEAIMGKLYG
ncbi:MAG: SDR family oxidoreductase [Oscillospiraceae bacterium]|jgi:NAD(P)-dependent dehydrogenase (short-subunit alcohol dehydrogenase family)|nr:SDR family oxidoreductase [Oscillospiraceae bacterium]